MDNFKLVQAPEFYLAGNGISVSETSIIIKNFSLDDVELAMTDFGSIAYGTLEPNTEREEIISWTGITQNGNDTATLTGVTRGLKKKAPYDQDLTLRKQHGGNTPLVISNNPQVYDKFTSKLNDESIEGVYTFSQLPRKSGSTTATLGNELVTLDQLNATSLGTATVGFQKISGISGESLTAGNIVYFKTSDQKWYKADADITATHTDVKLGVVQSTVAIDIAITVLIYGRDTNQTGMTPGATYYLSNTAGGISTTPGTNNVSIGVALSATDLLFIQDYINENIPSTSEKAALAGGSTFGTPSSTNKFITEDYLSSASGLPVRTEYTSTATNRGSSTTQFDVSNPTGTTYRYTWDGTGTDPLISAATMPTGSLVYISGSNLNASNKGLFIVTGSGTDYFEVTNASGVIETNKTLGTGFLLTNAVANGTWTKPAKLKYIEVEVVGGGADGSNSTTSFAGAGGSAGGYAMKRIPAASLSSNEYFIIGAKTLPSVFGLTSPVVSTGATANAYTEFAGEPGTATGGTININGEGGKGAAGNPSQGGNGGNTRLGTGGKGGSRDGGGNATSASAGTGYGSGGGGGSSISGTSSSGNAGRQGVVVITEYYL